MPDSDVQDGGAGHDDNQRQVPAAPQQVQRPQLEAVQGAGDFGPPRIDHAPQGGEIAPPGGDFAPQGHGNLAPPAGDDYEEDRKEVGKACGAVCFCELLLITFYYGCTMFMSSKPY